MGQAAINGADYSIITSDNPRTEDPERIIEDILKGIPSSAREGDDYSTIINRKEAIEHAIHCAEKNDMVLIAGKGHESYQIIGTNTIRFDDREVARSALKERNR